MTNQTVNSKTLLEECRLLYRELRKGNEHIHCSFHASDAIDQISEKYNIGHGSEGFCDEFGQHGIIYLNMGDTYDTTIVFRSNSERFSIGNWGTIVENAPNGRYQ